MTSWPSRDRWRSRDWRPLSELHTAPDGARVRVLCTDAMIVEIEVRHGPARTHGVTLAVELPVLAALWSPA